MSIHDAAKIGHREALEAMRDDLAMAMDLAEPQVKAQLAAQLRQVLAELAALPEDKPTVLTGAKDELAARRAKTGQVTTAGSAQRKSRRTSATSG